MKLDSILAGMIAGTVASVPMTLWMTALHRALPPPEQYPLPPHQVTLEAVRVAGLPQALDQPGSEEAASLAGHFAYGGITGAVYGLFADAVPLPKPVSGVLFGLAVWAGSYLGWLPAVGLHPLATHEPAGRNLLMISAHVVWGVTLGGLQERLAGHAGDKPGGREATRSGLHVVRSA